MTKKDKFDQAKYFKQWLINRKYSLTTIENYCYSFCCYNREHPTRQINNKLIEKFIEKHNTHCARAFIKVLLEFNNLKTIDYNIPKIRGRVKKRQLHTKVLTPAQIEYLLMKLKNIQDQLIVILMFEGGLRVSEAINIKIGNIDWDNNSISIIGKGNKERKVNFTPRTRRILLVYLGNRVMYKNESLFKRRTRQAVWLFLSKLKEELPNRRLHPHMLRHSCATRFIKNKVSLKIIKDYLGHEKIASTEIYTHLDDSDIKEAWDKTFN